MRYAPLIAIALVGWALAILGIVELAAAVAFSGVALTTLAVVLGFVRLERGAERREDGATVVGKCSARRAARHAQVPLTSAAARWGSPTEKPPSNRVPILPRVSMTKVQGSLGSLRAETWDRAPLLTWLSL
jgi:hypothetical protein